MRSLAKVGWWMLASSAATAAQGTPSRENITFYNPIIPGFHPDPSCVYVPQWDNTFFCASSSFNAFPGIPIHASKDLQSWRLIGHVLNRPEQLPRLTETNASTGGIWAPTLRYRSGKFYLVTTLVDDDKPQEDVSRWDNIFFEGTNPYDSQSWSNPIHFKFNGYDPDLFWHDNGKAYITASHSWQIKPEIQQAEINLETGETGEFKPIWEGTGAKAPEGPHIYRKDGWYYLLIAEGGTELGHMVTMARSKNINGPYESNPGNPVLTNANTTSYFQTVGHAELFQDGSGNWWGVALSTRGGPAWTNYPMGRETVMTPVTWGMGEWPVIDRIQGKMSGWSFTHNDAPIPGYGHLAEDGDDIVFSAGSSLPMHFTHWRAPVPGHYAISPPGHPDSLELRPSRLNLTGLNGRYAGKEGITFVGRRQEHSFFSYFVELDFSPPVTAAEEGVEAGISVFLTQDHHLDLGIVLLPTGGETGELAPHVRVRGMPDTSVPGPVVERLPSDWVGKKLKLEVRAGSDTHYVFLVGLAGAGGDAGMLQVATVSNEAVSWGFTGTILGVYSTSNGGTGSTPAHVSKWRYIPRGQCRDTSCSEVATQRQRS